MNEFGKYRLFRKYASLDGVNYTPLDEYQALLVENNTCQCGYREFEYRFDGEYKNETFKKYEIWKEYSFCPTDSSYDELTGNVDYRNPIAADGVMLATYLGNGSNRVKLCNNYDFCQSMAVNNYELGSKTKEYKFNNTDINEVAYTNVTSISASAFTECSRLTSVIIPDSVTTIYSNSLGGSFANCTSLTSVTIGNGVTTIGSNAFEGCSSLTSVKIGNSLKRIGSMTFYKCSGLTSVEIPDSVTEIGTSAFTFCKSLTSVTIGSGVTIIKERAFTSCEKLTSINIPDGVTSIGNVAFYNCLSLTSIEIPDGVTEIGTSAFTYCISLKSVRIGSGMINIGSSIFAYCQNLSSITCYAKIAPTLLGTNNFKNLPYSGTLHVPNGSDYSSWLRKLPSGWTIEYI